jgi:undecaprenyl-diphosphatase
MTIFQAIILGLVQGLGEFLPISSSAHLILAPWFFHWNDQGLAFDVALHWGTLLAVLIYFRNDVWLIIKGFFHSLFKSTRDLENNIYQKLAWLLLIASIPGAIIGKLLESEAEHAFREPWLIAITLSAMGLILYFVDRFAPKEKDLNHIGWKQSLLVGLSQALAIIPGVSRSGATMTMGRLLKFTREDAAKFSFLMSIPIILGAGLLKLPDLSFNEGQGALLAGFVSSFVFGMLAIKFLLRYIAKHDFALFAWYRLLLAAIIVIVYIVR